MLWYCALVGPATTFLPNNDVQTVCQITAAANHFHIQVRAMGSLVFWCLLPGSLARRPLAPFRTRIHVGAHADRVRVRTRSALLRFHARSRADPTCVDIERTVYVPLVELACVVSTLVGAAGYDRINASPCTSSGHDASLGSSLTALEIYLVEVCRCRRAIPILP